MAAAATSSTAVLVRSLAGLARPSALATLCVILFAARVMKKELLASKPWRGEKKSDKFQDVKMKVTNNPGSTPIMHIRRKMAWNLSTTNGEEETEQTEWPI